MPGLFLPVLPVVKSEEINSDLTKARMIADRAGIPIIKKNGELKLWDGEILQLFMPGCWVNLGEYPLSLRSPRKNEISWLTMYQTKLDGVIPISKSTPIPHGTPIGR